VSTQGDSGPGGFVERAAEGDVPAIAALQARAWQAAYREVLGPAELARLTPESLQPVWQAAVTAPPSPQHSVWVARGPGGVVGFAALAPAGDGTADLVALAVEPDRQRQGHGSRLLSAVAEAAGAAGLSTLQAWAPEADRPLQNFLSSAGFGPDGVRRRHRTADDREVLEVRLSARLG
jgi:GNAT superfamily N-acetyltransferase